MIGVSLLFGDGATTPAISMLGALEGLPIASETARAGLAAGMLFLLFATQKFGTRVIGLCSGPICLLWFVTLAALGIYNMSTHLAEARLVAEALSPTSIALLWRGGVFSDLSAWRLLGGVTLVFTCSEALYADVGHFGRGPITASWVFVFPCLVL